MTIILRQLPGLEKSFVVGGRSSAEAGYAVIDRVVSQNFKRLQAATRPVVKMDGFDILMSKVYRLSGVARSHYKIIKRNNNKHGVTHEYRAS
jgi:hypothetical protein